MSTNTGRHYNVSKDTREAKPCGHTTCEFTHSKTDEKDETRRDKPAPHLEISAGAAN